MSRISRVLVANRGEIAVRIIKACRELGIETVAAVSEADKESLPAKMADRSVCIGPARAIDSYLKTNTIIAAALGTGSDAIHPGYGFLAEQPELADACNEHGIAFIGPSVDALRQMGNKLFARRIVESCGMPVIPGSERVAGAREAIEAAEEVGYPVLLKGAAGGGGKGIVIARNAEEIASVFDTVSTEVHAAFGDGTIYIEHYIPNVRHIEVQVLGDRLGNLIHLGERDCSIQRRYQKLIEESPSVAVTPALREEICSAAVVIAKRIQYAGAGTVEFILDRDSGRFYFLEMNTRIQVEHTVTEEVTGVDLVKEQIRIASGEPLGLKQEDIHQHGHAIECRITAERADAGFLPCPGWIREWIPPQGPGIRIDTHCFPGYFIPPYYDSLLAKVITRGSDRTEAIERMRYALENFSVSGVDTTIPFLLTLLRKPDYLKGEINTRWLENTLASRKDGEQ